MKDEKWEKTHICNEVFDFDNTELEKLYEIKEKLEKKKKELKKKLNKYK